MLKPFVIKTGDRQVELIISSEQLNEVKLSPGRLCDELDNAIFFNVIGFETLRHYEASCGIITETTIVKVTIKSILKDFHPYDADEILNCYNKIINKHYYQK